MKPATEIMLVVGVVFIISFLLTHRMRTMALARGLVDRPNERSSHSIPTPRGGGLAVVVAFLGATCYLLASHRLDWAEAAAVILSGGLVAAVGFFDDKGHVSPSWRLLVHFLAAFLAMWLIGGFPVVEVLSVKIELGWSGYLLGSVFLVWMLNLYNFMDGINGIASLEAITVALGGAALMAFSPIKTDDHILWLLTLAAAAFGFLLWNFPNAKIFMGDVGSGFLGFILGMQTLLAGKLHPEIFWAWCILLGVFIVDATVTLALRILRGERVHEAHRNHAYQILSRRFESHTAITVSVVFLNVTWLLPFALLCLWYPYWSFIFLVASYTPMVLVVLHIGRNIEKL